MNRNDAQAMHDALGRDAVAFHVGSFDSSGLPIEDQCSATHPRTGHGCIEAIGHEGLHYALGETRMQKFSGEAASGGGSSY